MDSDAGHEVEAVRTIVADEVEAFVSARRQAGVTPTVVALRSMATGVVESEMTRLDRRLPGLDEATRAELLQTLRRVTDKLVHQPTIRAKELGDRGAVSYATALAELFALDPDAVDAVTRPVEPDPARGTSHERPPSRHPRLGPRHHPVPLGGRPDRPRLSAARSSWSRSPPTGDRDAQPLAQLGGTGVFVSALREALLDGRIDVAVHSLKDLPTQPAAGLALAAVPVREDPRDVVVARDGLTLGELPVGSRVGTGSPRRAAQLHALGLGLEIVDIRGNVDTRIRKVRDGEYDAVVLARAGLARLGRLDEATEVLDPLQMLPAPGQGALACRDAGGRRPDPRGGRPRRPAHARGRDRRTRGPGHARGWVRGPDRGPRGGRRGG